MNHREKYVKGTEIKSSHGSASIENYREGIYKVEIYNAQGEMVRDEYIKGDIGSIEEYVKNRINALKSDDSFPDNQKAEAKDMYSRLTRLSDYIAMLQVLMDEHGDLPVGDSENLDDIEPTLARRAYYWNGFYKEIDSIDFKGASYIDGDLIRELSLYDGFIISLRG